MSGNLESERGSNAGTLGCTGAGKMYPMDLAVAPQKITIVKSAAAPGSVCTTAAGDGKLQLAGSQGKAHLLSHAAAISLMRPAPQIISQGVASQPQMIVSGTSLMPSGTQVISQSSQIITQSQIIGPSGQLLTPQSQLIGTPTQLIGPQAQIISQGTQLINQGTQMIGQASQLMSGGGQSSGAQVLSVGTSLVGGASVVVSSGTALRSLPSSMRVLPPTSHHNVRPVSSVTVTPIPLAASKLSATPAPVGVSSHVPRGPAAGASLAVPRATVRPAIPHTVSALGGWSARGSLRGPALVYSARAALRGPVAAPALSPAPLSHSVHSQTPPATTLAGSGVISPAPRIGLPRVPPRAPPPRSPAPHAPRAPAALAPAPRPLPVLQRNYQPAKVVAVGARSALPVSGAARSALYYEVTRSAAPAPAPHASQYTYTHSALPVHSLPAVSMSVVAPEARLAPATSPAPAAPLAATSSAALARPSILRKRDVDGSPSKNAAVTASPFGSSVEESTGPVWGGGRGGGGGGGSTTESAASSPAPDDEPPSPPRADPSSPPPLPPATAAAAQHPPPPPPPPPLQHDISPRKKPRKQMLSSEVRACEPPPEEPPPSPPPIVHPPPRRSMLGAGWTCGWRPNAQHYTRPSDVRRREPRPPHVLELANQKHVLTKANGWKVHHLTAQMDDIVELESSSCDQLSVMLRSLDTEDLPELDCIKELIKGNMQRSRIVCEGMEEARADMLRVFTHRPLVADILARQADKRCFRKHRPSHSQN